MHQIPLTVSQTVLINHINKNSFQNMCLLPSVLWRCGLGGRKGHLACKKIEWWDAGQVIGLGQCADLHMAQLMPLPLTITCSSKSRLVLPFRYQLTW